MGGVYRNDGSHNVPLWGNYAYKDHNLATDNVDLFTIDGMIAITLMIGQVTTIVATTTTYQLRVKTTNEALVTATTITTDAAKTLYFLPGDNTTSFNNGGTPITRVAFIDAGWHNLIVVGDSLGTSNIIQSDLDAAGTGVIRWHLWWEPVIPGSTLIAA